VDILRVFGMLVKFKIFQSVLKKKFHLVQKICLRPDRGTTRVVMIFAICRMRHSLMLMIESDPELSLATWQDSPYPRYTLLVLQINDK
jgi:hypothetical protein